MARMFARTDRSFLSEWWWTIDRTMVACVAILIALGFVMALAASPAVSHTIGKPTYYLFLKQSVFLCAAAVMFIIVSMLPATAIKRLAFIMLGVSLLGLIATLFIGTTAKGATRWLTLAGFSLQPSEFLKPGFAVVTAWLFAEQRAHFGSRAGAWAFVLLIVVATLLFMQPDIGQIVLLSLLWAGVYFLSGGSWRFLTILIAIGLLAGAWFYTNVPHVSSRIDRFLNPALGDNYQVDKAMDAIRAGGFFGVGVGDGRVKSILPDAHSDYVFAVAAEEGGLVIGSFMLLIFAIPIWRALARLRAEKEHWVQLAGASLACLFGLQVLINLAVNLNLIPPKGMTLPFISYGGSSLLASAVGMGMLVGLMRRRSSVAMGVPPASHASFSIPKGGIV